MSDLTDEQLAEWEALEAAATEGPWSGDDEHGDIPDSTPAWCVSQSDEHGAFKDDIAYMADPHNHAQAEADAVFIAAARNAFPLLLRALRDARDERVPRQRKGLNAFLPDAPVRKAFSDEGVMRSIESWLDGEREKEDWHDGDTQTYRYRANLLEAALVRWRAVAAERDSLRAENRQLREFAEWLVSMDAPDFWARSERSTITLNDIIARARAALVAPTGQETPRHQAEAFRQRIDDRIRFGYECLTCGVEQLVPDFGPSDDQIAEAERQARVHAASIAASSAHPIEETK